MRRRPRGATLLEVVIYSALACLACGLMAKIMIDYRILSMVFDTRTRVTTTANLFFSQVRETLFQTKSQGVHLDSDGKILVVQTLEEADAQGNAAWRNEVIAFWFDSENSEIRSGRLSATELDRGYQGGRLDIGDRDLHRGVEFLENSGRYRPVLKDLTQFEMTRPGLGALSIAVKLERQSYQTKSETVERVGVFPVLVEREL